MTAAAQDSKVWTLPRLQQHLQYAVDLELWTIPFYMAPLYSLIERSSNAYLYIQSIINQEMLHVQLASNIANAYGFSPTFHPPVYRGTAVPHLDFDLDTPNPIETYHPYSAEIGPLDLQRLNAMCLIEYPEWQTGRKPDLHDDMTEYGSIGEFYDAVEFGAEELARHIEGGRNQVNYFSRFYADGPGQTVTASGHAGLTQVKAMIETIRDQGEGAKANDAISAAYQNTADDPAAALTHYDKFTALRNAQPAAEFYPVKPRADYTGRDRKLVLILQEDFAGLLHALERLFSGDPPDDFFATMVAVGADVQNCWINGVVPQFTEVKP